MPINEATKIIPERASSQPGTPNGTLAIIIMGDVNGIIENQNESDEFGSWNVDIIIIMANISGMVTGSINCCDSVSLSTAGPKAANMAA